MENEENKEIQEELMDTDLPIGTKEPKKLEAGKVKIESVSVDPVIKEGKEVGKKVTCLCKHPSKEELVGISSAAHVVGKKNIKFAGLWVNKDEDGFIAKHCALASFMNKLGAKSISEISGKEADTEIDENNYLCFKAY